MANWSQKKLIAAIGGGVELRGGPRLGEIERDHVHLDAVRLAELVNGDLGATQDDRKHVVEFVGDPACELGDRFDHQDPRQGRPAREVAREERLVAPQVPATAGRRALDELGHLVEQQERWSVR